jgi:hypothetical protein
MQGIILLRLLPMNGNEIVRYNGKIKEVVTISKVENTVVGFVYNFLPFGAIVAVVWYGTIEYSGEMSGQYFICFIFYTL